MNHLPSRKDPIGCFCRILMTHRNVTKPADNNVHQNYSRVLQSMKAMLKYFRCNLYRLMYYLKHDTEFSDQDLLKSGNCTCNYDE